MADLTGQNIQDTYQKIIQFDNGSLQDGTGSVILDSDELTALQTIGSAGITSTEWLEVANIGSANITPTIWGYVGSMQDVSTTSSPTFATINTGQGDNELYGMDQNVTTDSAVTFTNLTLDSGPPIGGWGSLTLPAGATAAAPHLQTYARDVNTPSLFLGDNGEDIITFVDEAGSTVSSIGQNGTYDGNATTATLATLATSITATANNSTDETVYLTFVDGVSGTQGIETDTGLTYNPSTNKLSAVIDGGSF